MGRHSGREERVAGSERDFSFLIRKSSEKSEGLFSSSFFAVLELNIGPLPLRYTPNPKGQILIPEGIRVGLDLIVGHKKSPERPPRPVGFGSTHFRRWDICLRYWETRGLWWVLSHSPLLLTALTFLPRTHTVSELIAM